MAAAASPAFVMGFVWLFLGAIASPAAAQSTAAQSTATQSTATQSTATQSTANQSAADQSASAQPFANQPPVPSLPLAPYGPNSTEAGQLVLGAGDVIDVNVFSTPELSGRLRVDQKGSILLPVGGELDINGLTPLQAAASVENRLRDAQIMLNPHVNVAVFQFATQGVTILGEVKLPGTYLLFGPHSLYDALSVAGGPTSTEGATITITHHRDPNHPEVIQVNSPNYSQIQRTTPIAPGDTVLVSKADLVYVVGDVRTPGSLPMAYGKRLTVLNVLAGSGGVNSTAKVTKSSIVRGTPDGAITIPLDLDKIIRNEAPNVELEASDVLVVPRSGLKVFLQSAVPSLTTSISTAVISALVVK